MLYTDQQLVENYLGRELTDKESNLLSTLVYAVERQIDKDLDTTFKNTASLYSAVRYFDGGSRYTNITPVQNITDISIVDADNNVDTTLTSDLYVTNPTGSTVTKSITTRYGRLPSGLSRLRVTGDFTEYGAEEAGVPSDIKTIATKVVGGMLAQSETSSTGVRSEKVEGHEVVYNGANGGSFIGGFFDSDPIVKSLMDARRIPLVDDSPSPYRDEDDDILGIY